MNAALLHRLGSALQRRTRSRIVGRAIEYLIFLLFNSVVPVSAVLGEGSVFAYGGIGVVLHKHCRIGRGCVIGQGVTIGSSVGYVTGADTPAPVIGDNVYLGAGCKVLGDISVGANSIVAANAVVVRDVPAGSVVGGVPAKIIGQTEPGYRAIRQN